MSFNYVPRMMSKPRVADNHLSRDEKLMDLLSTYHPVTLSEEGNYSERLTWCLEHCQSKFRDIKSVDGMDWYFENEQDAMMFAMKWV